MSTYLLGLLSLALAAATWFIRVVHRHIVLHLLRVPNLILLGLFLPLLFLLVGQSLELGREEACL